MAVKTFSISHLDPLQLEKLSEEFKSNCENCEGVSRVLLSDMEGQKMAMTVKASVKGFKEIGRAAVRFEMIHEHISIREQSLAAILS